MRKRREIAFDKFFLLCVFFGLFLTVGAIFLLCKKEVAEGLVIGGIGVLILVLNAVFYPCIYLFDEEGVSICYAFFSNERYLWENVRAVEVQNQRLGGNRASGLDLLYGFVFVLQCEGKGKKRFYTQGGVRVSLRTKRLFEKYWGGKIKGVFEETKNAVAQKKASKQAWWKAHSADKIVDMERESRADVRVWIAPFEAQAKEVCRQITANYLYQTKEGEGLKYRPETGYIYELYLKVEGANEPSEEIRVDLLYVRHGKRAYLGKKNKRAYEETTAFLSKLFIEKRI